MPWWMRGVMTVRCRISRYPTTSRKSGAAARFSELTEARTATIGPDEPDTVWTLQGLTRVLARMEAHDDARRAYARLYET